jgi:hypothetical protein
MQQLVNGWTKFDETINLSFSGCGDVVLIIILIVVIDQGGINRGLCGGGKGECL